MTAHADQTTGLTIGRAANWAPEVEFSPLHALSHCQMKFLFASYISLLIPPWGHLWDVISNTGNS